MESPRNPGRFTDLVAKRIERLQDAAESVRTYVATKLAHSDRGEPPISVTSGDFDAALDEIGAALTDLYLLLTCKSLASPEPVIQSPWRRAFTVPWLQGEEFEREQRIRKAISERHDYWRINPALSRGIFEAMSTTKELGGDQVLYPYLQKELAESGKRPIEWCN